jgi:PAS domain S-box-containing protein
MAGEPIFRENLPLVMRRKGYNEQTWFTFSYSPIHDESGTVAGMFCAVTETTQQFLGDLRQRFQLDLSDKLKSLDSPEEIISAATRMLGMHLNASRCWYAQIDNEHRTFHTRAVWDTEGLPVLPKDGRIDDFGDQLVDHLQNGRELAINDIARDSRTARFTSAYEALNIRSILIVPLVKAGKLTVNLNISKARPYRWSEQEILIVKDVADRTWSTVENALAQFQLKKERDQSQYILDSMKEGLVLFDRNWKIRQINAEGQRILQKTASEIIGKTYSELWPEISEKHVDAIYVQVKETGMANPVEFQLQLADGQAIWLEARAYASFEKGISIFFRNISRKKQVDEALRRSQMRSENALSIAQLGTFEWNIRTNEVNASSRTREIFGLAKNEGDQADHYFSRVFAEDVERVRNEIDAAMQGNGKLHTEYRIVLPHGEVRHIVSMSACQKAADGKWERHIGVFSDITEQKQAEQELYEGSRRKDEFLAMLAHELRNPLAPINAAAELMEMVNLDEDCIKQMSRIIIRQVHHMTGLVDDLLDVSRVTRGLVKLDASAQDMKAIVSSSIEQVMPLMEAQRHHLHVKLPPESVYVMGDAKRLVQIITNILNNAAKYTAFEGSITLGTAVEQGNVVLTVEDNGIGIDPELQPHIFELFSQAKRSSDRSQGGLGIGLALVKSLVELHQGTITCHSEGLGMGSRFIITLPLFKGDIESQGPSKKNSASQLNQKRKVLVVDDNVDAAKTLAALLEAWGHEVLVEHSSLYALERAKKEVPDVCLLDIGLPDMDGNELARRLRKQKETADMLLIAVTGYGQEHDRAHALDAGFDFHLVKPINSSSLTALLKSRRSLQTTS